MKIYQYKLQWIFSIVTENKDLYSIIKILGARSLTKIVFRDSNLDIISEWSKMVQYSEKDSTNMTISHIKFISKKNPEIKFIELLRK